MVTITCEPMPESVVYYNQLRLTLGIMRKCYLELQKTSKDNNLLRELAEKIKETEKVIK